MFEDESLILEFVVESKEHLETIEPDLLAMERNGAQTEAELINRVFRAIHSIKGTAGFFGFNAIKNLSHVMESVLMAIRNNEMTPDANNVDALLSGVDKLKQMFEDVHASEDVDYQPESQRLEVILDPSKAPATSLPMASVDTASALALPPEAPPVSVAEDLPDLESIRDALAHGRRLYRIETTLDALAPNGAASLTQAVQSLQSTGDILDNVLDGLPPLETCLETPTPVVIYYATVLEEDLIAATFNIPETQIRRVEIPEALQPKASAPVDTPPPIAEAPPAAAAPEPSPKPLPESSTPVADPAAVAKPTPPKKEEAPKAPGGVENAETIRVRIDLLNKLMDLAGEMVLARNQLNLKLGAEASQISGLASILQNVNLITSDLQENVMQTRMQPIGNVFGKFPRVVRDLARQLQKEIQLDVLGEDVELDKSIIESLSDPLTHLIRNCCDHAIELPAERVAAGKPAQGTIRLNAYHEGGQINVTIVDDGRGIDPEKVGQKALAKGLITEAVLAKMSQQELVNLIFLPGFSTAEQVSEISGRGVGMDVVRTNVEKFGGQLKVESTLGQGTTVILRMPLTLAIIPSLIVGTAGERFAVPQINLVELVHVSKDDVPQRIERLRDAEVLRLRGKLLPLVNLASLLGVPQDPENRRDYSILVLKHGSYKYGLIVDTLFDTEEIVVKPMSAFIKDCKCFAGATIMGDGRVAMILDPGGIVTLAKLNFTDAQGDGEKSLAADQRTAQTVALFTYGKDEYFAMPLAYLLRLEQFDLQKIEVVAGRELLPYQGKGLPLIRLDRHLPVQPFHADKTAGQSPGQSTDAYLLIPKTQGQLAGILASQILDIIEVDMNLDKPPVEHPGVMGSAIVNNRLTLFINPQGFLERSGLGVA